MKKNVFLAAVIMSLPLFVNAQSDDVYFTPKRSSVEKIANRSQIKTKVALLIIVVVIETLMNTIEEETLGHIINKWV